jgi:hypothetical protein
MEATQNLKFSNAYGPVIMSNIYNSSMFLCSLPVALSLWNHQQRHHLTATLQKLLTGNKHGKNYYKQLGLTTTTE